MNGREKRIRIFEETRQLYESNVSLREAVRRSVEKQQIIWETDSPVVTKPRYHEPAQLLLRSERTVQAAEKYARRGKRVAALNFASSVVPGGGVLKGSNAQEEGICRISTLYPVISDPSVSGFYRRHWELASEGKLNGKNTDDCIFTPGVTVLRKDPDGDFLTEKERYSFNVITCAAPDQRHHAQMADYTPSEEELYVCFRQRIRRILMVAAMNSTEVVILGAFGCGAFRNDPGIVSKAFGDALQCDENMYRFETVEFAIPYNPDEPWKFAAFAGISEIKTVRSLESISE